MKKKIDLPWYRTMARDRLTDSRFKEASEGALGILFLLEARAWISESPGSFVMNRKPMNPDMIARAISRDPVIIAPLIKELISLQILERAKDGTIRIPEMAQSFEALQSLSAKRAQAGKKGADSRWQTDGKNSRGMANLQGKSWQTDSKPSESDSESDQNIEEILAQDRDLEGDLESIRKEHRATREQIRELGLDPDNPPPSVAAPSRTPKKPGEFLDIEDLEERIIKDPEA